MVMACLGNIAICAEFHEFIAVKKPRWRAEVLIYRVMKKQPDFMKRAHAKQVQNVYSVFEYDFGKLSQ